jgi:sulfate transport system permease protein
MTGGVNRRVLPGLGISLGYAILYLSILVLIPLTVCIVKAASLSPHEFLSAVWTPRTRAAYALSFAAALIAAIVNVVLGTIVAWTLVRYQFPGRRIVDALVDIPLALPTAVAGLVFASLYVPDGWIGQFLAPLGIKAAYSRLGIVLVLVFTGFPFVVRTVQPVLEDLDAEMEEAAAVLGASRWQTFRRVILPTLIPPALTGFALAFARGLGEYGSVVFISSNKMFETEIAPMLVLVRLEEFSYAEAAAIAVVLLGFSFVMLAGINYLEWRSKRYAN